MFLSSEIDQYVVVSRQAGADLLELNSEYDRLQVQVSIMAYLLEARDEPFTDRKSKRSTRFWNIPLRLMMMKRTGMRENSNIITPWNIKAVTSL
jgi:hypothetical protein